MTKEDVQRIWLLSGTAVLTLVSVIAVTVLILEQVDHLPVMALTLGSFAVLILNVTFLSSARKSSRAVLFFGRMLLWLGLLAMIAAPAWGILSSMGII